MSYCVFKKIGKCPKLGRTFPNFGQADKNRKNLIINYAN